MEREIGNYKLPWKRDYPAERGVHRRPQFSLFNFQFPIFNPSRRPPRGFTLVELLVVITIIGILMAIIIPGVNVVREQSRQTTCSNNQKQLATAILTYELAKNHLPGVLNQFPHGTPPTNVQYNWVEALFPYLDRGDMWNTVLANNVASISTMELKVTICPDDPYTVDPTSTNAQALLSYGVNDGFFVNYVNNPPTDFSTPTPYVVAPTTTSKLTSRPNPNQVAYARGESVTASTTIMVGERTGDGSATYPRAGTSTYPTSGPWTTTLASAGSAAAACSALAFHWPVQYGTTQPVNPPWPISPNIMVSAHPGKVIVAFFDGHCEKVNNDATYPQ